MKKVLIAALVISFTGVLIFFLRKKRIIDPREALRYAGTLRHHWYDALLKH